MADRFEYTLFRLGEDPQEVIGYGDPQDQNDLDTKYTNYIHKTLNEFGADGWELVKITGHLVTMKRRY